MLKNKNSIKNESELFEDFLIERNDEIDNASYNLLTFLSGRKGGLSDEEGLPWDMQLIGEVNEFAQKVLEEAGYPGCCPYYIENFKRKTIPCYKAGVCKLMISGHCPFKESLNRIKSTKPLIKI